MDNLLIFILPALLAAVLSWIGVRLIRRYARQRLQGTGASKGSETARGGGMVILAVVLLIFMPLGLSLGDPSQVVRFSLAGAIIATIGFFDDFRTLPRPARLLTQALAALIFVPAAPIWTVGLPRMVITLNQPESYIISVLWIIGLCNAYNYMDGIDGLAGGQAVLAGGLWAGIGFFEGNSLVILLGVLIAGASAGFLVYNLPPASIYMGDVGGMFLGFSLAALPMLSVAGGASPRLIPTGVLIVGLFLFDAAFTFLRYVLKGQIRGHPYRSHLYQRLVKLGASPYRVTILYLLISIGFGISGIIYWRDEAWVALLVCAFVCLILFSWVTYQEGAQDHSSPTAIKR